MSSRSSEHVIGIIKEWASPALIAIIGMFIWRDLSELRDDVKFLVTQQTASQVKIESLEQKVISLENDLNRMRYVFYSGNRDAKLEDNLFEPIEPDRKF